MKRTQRQVIILGLLAIATAATAQEAAATVQETEATDSVTEKNATIKEVQVTTRRPGILRGRGVENAMTITSGELLKAACCNLGESFTTNPSVDVDYSDAATGARQIKLLGLSGQYVQLLTENIPNYRGAASPYALSYIPGPWMQSIQVSKGSASVKNGYESITGQINVEMLKPQADESIHANVFADTKSRVEANADANIHLNNRWSTGMLLHWQDNYGHHDSNHDGFLDMPKVRQYMLQDRWAYLSGHYIFQASVKALQERRMGGQKTMSAQQQTGEQASHPYHINIETQRYEVFAKNAFIINQEHNSNVALILSGSWHDMDATYGSTYYRETQKNGYASLLYETDFSDQHSLSTGISLNHDNLRQSHETTPGAYVQYTFNLHHRLTLMAGLRADHSNHYGTFVTPRFHVKFAPNDLLTIRASAGKGYRTVHALAENNFLLGTGRQLVIDPLEQEEAWNYGVSTSLHLPLLGRSLRLDAEYYYTRFLQQVVIDYDSDPTLIHITNLQGRSYSHTLQVEASYPIVKGLTFTAAYRLNDVKTTYGRRLMERPLTSRYKSLFTASYKPGLGLWQLDATLQINGGGRIPAHLQADHTLQGSSRFHHYEQLQAQVTREFRHLSIYVGGENLTNRRQKNPIVSADNPWSECFDPTLVWGPVEGRMFYAGVRLNFQTMPKY